ncbi:putative membrane protein [Mycobacterium ulcerans str. Harvey]|uniref:Membrane protein n=1 Tax=Mycobacterium ulcerans str. Harvey TaxID=1299332 RepID=A0ABP3ALH5_MYCUL|nr:putative membrane protein [Mycobacterium ulcerans str. Harvey]
MRGRIRGSLFAAVNAAGVVGVLLLAPAPLLPTRMTLPAIRR